MTQILENPHIASNNARNLPRAIPDPEFLLTLSVKAGSESVLTEFCIAHLRERGYAVSVPNEKWETPGEFCKRLEVCHEALRRAMRKPRRPDVAIRFTATGRMAEVCSNVEFDAFVKRYKTPQKNQQP